MNLFSKIAFKLASKEMIRKWKWTLTFCLNLSFGLIGFLTIISYKDSIQKNIELNSKKILSADISISARKNIPPEIIEKTKLVLNDEFKIKNIQISSTYELFAMIKNRMGSKLVLVKAIDTKYPLYGDIQLENKLIKSNTEKAIFADKNIWPAIELKSILSLQANDEIELGQMKFKIDSFVTKDSTQTFRLASLAPRIFIDKKWLKEAGLLQFGSTFSEIHLFKLPESFNNSDLDKIQKRLFELITDPAIQIETPKTVAEDTTRQLTYLSDFLGLISIIAILLSALGSAFLFKVFIQNKIKDMAIYKSLGLSHDHIRSLFVIQVILLSFSTILFTTLGSHLFMPILANYLNQFTSGDFKADITLNSLLLCFLIVSIVLSVISIPYLLTLQQVQTAQLLQENKFISIKTENFIGSIIIGTLFLVLVCFFNTNSWITTFNFIAGLLLVIIILSIFSWFILKLAVNLKFSNWIPKYSLKSLIHKKYSSILLFVIIGTSTLLLNIVPQLKNSLNNEFILSEKSKLPSLFLFDIQDEQLEPLKKFLQEKNYPLDSVSPLVRGRIISINNIPYERKQDSNTYRTREEERDARFRNRGVNLTYRSYLSDSETIVEGKDLFQSKDTNVTSPFPISLEYKYAERIGAKIGDIIKFDVQGTEIEGLVTNFRKVKWNSFQPNFFISFKDGVLNEAPKTHIAIVNNMDSKKSDELIQTLSKSFTNISIINVKLLIADIISIATQMSLSLQLMAYLALFTGFVVLLSIIYIQNFEKKLEITLLKVLGASNLKIQQYLTIDYILVIFISCLLGTIMSLFTSFLILRFVFDISLVISINEILFLNSLILIIGFLASSLINWILLKNKVVFS